MGNDPPGQFTRALHPRIGRHDEPPPRRDPGRPLGDRAGERLAAEHHPQPALVPRIKQVLEREQLRRAPCARADDARSPSRRPRSPWLAPDRRDVPRVGRSAAGTARASRCGASCSTGSTTASRSPSRRGRRRSGSSPAEYEVIPNGVLIPPSTPSPAGATTTILFVGRHEPRKGLPVLLARLAGDPPANGCAPARSSAPTRCVSGC